MGIEKAEIKALTAEEVADAVEASARAAKERVQALAGSAEAFKRAAKGVEDLTRVVRKELEEGGFAKLPETPEQAAALVRDWLLKARGLMIHLADSTTTEGLRAEGELLGLEKAARVARERAEAERAKAKAIAEAPAEVDDPRKRPVGVRPGPSVAARRRAEAGAAASAPEEPAKKGRKGSGRGSRKKGASGAERGSDG